LSLFVKLPVKMITLSVLMPEAAGSIVRPAALSRSMLARPGVTVPVPVYVCAIPGPKKYKRLPATVPVTVPLFVKVAPRVATRNPFRLYVVPGFTVVVP
jgi:hypothetical protein